MNSEDDTSQLVQRLVIKLLKGCSNTFTKNITEDVSAFLSQNSYDLCPIGGFDWLASSCKWAYNVLKN